MEDDFKYVRATGALSAMTRFLIDDLKAAVDLLAGEEHYQIGQFKITIKHAEQVLADVEASEAISPRIPQQDRPVSGGKVKDTDGYVDYPVSTDLSDFAKDLGLNK